MIYLDCEPNSVTGFQNIIPFQPHFEHTGMSLLRPTSVCLCFVLSLWSRLKYLIDKIKINFCTDGSQRMNPTDFGRL